MPLYTIDVYISIVTPKISLSHPNYSNLGQTNDRAIQPTRMASFSSGRFKGRKSPPCLLPASPSSATHLCGPVPARNADPKTQLGGQPPRARKPLPQSSALRLCRPPLRFALSTPPCSVTRVGIPLSLQLLPPAFARWRSAFGCQMPTTQDAKTKEQRP